MNEHELWVIAVVAFTSYTCGYLMGYIRGYNNA